MELKLLPEKDIEAFWKMQGRLVKKYSFDHVKKDYAKNKELYIGCYEGPELIGMAYGFIEKDQVVLSGMGVKPDLWKKGIGLKILSFFEEQAKKTGKKKVGVGAANAPTNVVGFYEKAGYKVIKVHKEYTSMEKEI